MGKLLYDTSLPAKHESCIWFDELLGWMEDNYPGFRLDKLADDLGCTTNRIRDVRKGKSVLDLKDLEVLRRKYGVNILFLTDHRQPHQLSGELSVVNEPGVQYGNDLKKENEMLRHALSDKEKLIELYEEKLGVKEKIPKKYGSG